MKQSEIFAESEGDAWYERNKDKPRLPDPVLGAMEACNLQPKTVLEIGCGDGWRLVEIQKKWHALALGCDPSTKALKNGPIGNITTWKGDALNSLISEGDSFFDLIIFGFCLYLIDREDLMMITAHADRVLQDGGHIIIHDFNDGIYRVPYKYKEGIWSYHMDYAALWEGNPVYRHIYEAALSDGISVTILEKDIAGAYE